MNIFPIPFRTLILALCIGQGWGMIPLMAQSKDSPAREFRGAWIATVKNIDWPSRAGLSTIEQQEEILSLLDELEAVGINAVIFQVRPASDAFYPSAWEPWSEWLSGEQGLPPDPFYDPLAFIIDACHERGMEFHAWFNPFRAATDWDSLKYLAPSHIGRRRPDLTVAYGRNLYLDPGIPEARTYVKGIILELAHKYPIDAVHFDDYFYPYRLPEQDFPDTASFRLFGDGFSDRAAWRRDNINQFVSGLHDSLLSIDPYIPFGISPFGVWRNKSADPRGSDSRAGQTSYDGLHADIRYWLEQGWVDYVVPQLYFSIGYPPADFAKLLDWWQANTFNKHLYIGHALYKIDNNADLNWEDADQISRQIELVRNSETAQGSMYFSAKWFRKNPLGVRDSLVQNAYRHKAILPNMPWIDAVPPAPPFGVEIDVAREGLSVNWESNGKQDEVAYFGIYRSQGKLLPVKSPEFLVRIHRDSLTNWIDEETRPLRKYQYFITALDRYHNESQPSPVRAKRRWSGLFRRKK